MKKQFQATGVFCLDDIPTVTNPISICVLPQNKTLCSIPIHEGADFVDTSRLLRQELIFVADSQNRIHLFDQDYRHVLSFGQTGSKPGRFDNISSIVRLSSRLSSLSNHSQATNRWTQLIVCDQNNHRIQILDLNLIFRASSRLGWTATTDHRHVPDSLVAEASIEVIGSKGTDVSQFRCPRGVQVDSTNGNIYVADQLNHRIQVFSGYSDTNTMPTLECPFPQHLRSFGKRGKEPSQLFRPFGLALSLNHVIVCDSGNNRLAVYTKSGGFIVTYGTKGSDPGQFRDPRHIALLDIRQGARAGAQHIHNEKFHIVVGDSNNFRVQIMTENGDFVRVLSYLQDSCRVEQFYTRVQELLAMQLQARSMIPPSLQHLPLQATLHPSSSVYQLIVQIDGQLSRLYSTVHQPIDLAFDSKKHLYVCDRPNDSVHVYETIEESCEWSHIADHLSSMCGMTVNATGRVLLVADTDQNRVVVFDTSSSRAKWKGFIGAATYGNLKDNAGGFKEGELNAPTGICIIVSDGIEYVVVSDCGNNRIQGLFDTSFLAFSHVFVVFEIESGNFCTTISAFGHTQGFLHAPQGIDAMQGEIYVCDQMNHRIQVFNLNTGEFCRMFGTYGAEPGELKLPTGLAVCEKLVEEPTGCDFGPHRGAKVAVADTGNHRIQVFSAAGEPMLCTGQYDSPLDVSIHPRSGFLIVCDTGNACVHVLDRSGQVLQSWGPQLAKKDQFYQPRSVALPLHSPTLQVLIGDGIRLECCTLKSLYEKIQRK